MLLTEEEARKKWCPFARTGATMVDCGRADSHSEVIQGIIGASVNRDVGSYDKDGNETVQISGRHRCIASECMAWRWRRSGFEGVTYHPDGSKTYIWPGPAPTYGYCGLAGDL